MIKGFENKIGICKICGNDFQRNSGVHVYCTNCKKEHIIEYDRSNYRNNERPSKTLNRVLSYDTEMEGVALLKGSIRVDLYYDLDWNDKKVDVKSCKYEKVKLKHNNKETYSYRWRFSTQRQKDKVDYFLCIGKDIEGDKTEFAMLIPNEDISTTAVSISKKNFYKFNKYLLS